MKTSAQHDKNILALVVMAVAFVIFLIFYNYQPFLEESNDINKFVILSAFGLGLLLVLFYLVSARTDKHLAKKSSTKKSAKRRR